MGRPHNRQHKHPSSIKDTVLVYIPMDVTADLGIAMRRTREKRLKKIRAIYPSLVPEDDDDAFPTNNNHRHDDDRDSNDKKEDNGDKEDNLSLENDNDNFNSSSKKKIKPSKLNDTNMNMAIPKREHYGSVLDYLEAKYVRGVMLDDIDEKLQRKKELKRKERRKKKQQQREEKKQKAAKEKNENSGSSSVVSNENDRSLGSSMGSDGDDHNSLISDSDDGTGSCYSDASGFLDDSLLRTSVAEQVMASSSYGATRIEAESRKSSKRNAADLDQDAENFNVDDGFFVNVGDLEMVDGYDDADAADIDFDMLDSSKNKKKNKNKKKDKEKTHTTTHKPKDSSSSTAKDKKKHKDSNVAADSVTSSNVKKRKNSTSSTSSSTKGTGVVSSSSSPKKKIKKEKKPDKQTKHKSTDESEKEKKKPELPPEVQAIRDECDVLKKEMKRLYQLVVKEIKKLPPENFPRKKKKKKEMIKVSITIPQSKKPGDEIQFANPRVPGQRLKVQVPENGVPGKSFVVSVPAPVDTKSKSIANSNQNTNVFSREAKDILDRYSKAYDDWIEMEAKYHETAPDGDRKYKPNNQRMKKFDKLLSIFPTDLLEPIDASYLRKVVRRSRQNRSKRIKNQMITSTIQSEQSLEDSTVTSFPMTVQEDNADDGVNSTTTGTGGEKETRNNSDDDGDGDGEGDGPEAGNDNDETQTSSHNKKQHPHPMGVNEFLTLNVPQKGTHFSTFTFNPCDFVR